MGSASPGSAALWLLTLYYEFAHNATGFSIDSGVAYVTTQFFRGAGVQAATFYRDGREETNVETGPFATNEHFSPRTVQNCAVGQPV